MSGLKIDYHKSQLIVMGALLFEQARVPNMLKINMELSHLPIFGFTMSDHKLTIADLEPLVAMVGRRIEAW
jgi:hypothetical protein